MRAKCEQHFLQRIKREHQESLQPRKVVVFFLPPILLPCSSEQIKVLTRHMPHKALGVQITMDSKHTENIERGTSKIYLCIHKIHARHILNNITQYILWTVQSQGLAH
ncbi:hypothetical protein ROZALSC1DRAFT_25411 [Rozella allomycis CSF55]|uniref:Uncharacterized protein n=1 Tax=Rozella allomycis (strain CSF55) TaxID=988480 RepID=A0A4P9YDP4_ROZAC|nr:hypothetical protein ROZALSC1DRAFT_25411 [Rozella allomycis CSF55]